MYIAKQYTKNTQYNAIYNNILSNIILDGSNLI